jgi:hypothetical protein
MSFSRYNLCANIKYLDEYKDLLSKILDLLKYVSSGCIYTPEPKWIPPPATLSLEQ